MKILVHHRGGELFLTDEIPAGAWVCDGETVVRDLLDTRNEPILRPGFSGTVCHLEGLLRGMIRKIKEQNEKINGLAFELDTEVNMTVASNLYKEYQINGEEGLSELIEKCDDQATKIVVGWEDNTDTYEFEDGSQIRHCTLTNKIDVKARI